MERRAKGRKNGASSISSKTLNGPVLADKLPEAEWKFDAVPERERVACLYYEYSRESTKVLADLTVWIRHFPCAEQSPTGHAVIKKMQEAPADAVALERFFQSPARIVTVASDFPSSPWLSIPEKVRRAGMDRIGWDKIETKVRMEKKGKDRPALAKLVFDTSFVVSDWSYTDTELIQQFKEWLCRERRDAPDNSKRGRHQNPSDLLSHLTALRLRRHAARVRGSASRVVEVKNADARNYFRDAQKAEVFIKEFYR